MTEEAARIDDFLGVAMQRGAPWPSDWTTADQHEALTGRALYHGIAALLTDQVERLTNWPDEVVARLRQQAVGQAMWELRHRDVLGRLLAHLDAEGVEVLVLKGSALAYDLYPVAAHRARGDSDLLVLPADLPRARHVLGELGYVCHHENQGRADEFTLQEEWVLASKDGMRHSIDLHWQLLNAPALAEILPTQEIWAQSIALPQLGPGARAMSHVHTLVHTCVHRAMHLVAPYTVDGRPYYGADRLIWAMDLDRLGRSLDESEWAALSSLACGQGVAPVILNGLDMARRILMTPVPASVLAALEADAGSKASQYLLGSGRIRRGWADLRAVRGLARKASFLRDRTLPSTSFVRRKYPNMAGWPLALLHARRIGELLAPRGDR